MNLARGATPLIYGTGRSGTPATRFAMLNKTARPVDKNTLLLIDDSDICNVIPRRILEDDIIDDRFVKWVGGQNLGPSDPQLLFSKSSKTLPRIFFATSTIT